MTKMIQIQNYIGNPDVRSDRWIKLFDNVVTMSNWYNSDKIEKQSYQLAGKG